MKRFINVFLSFLLLFTTVFVSNNRIYAEETEEINDEEILEVVQNVDEVQEEEPELIVEETPDEEPVTGSLKTVPVRETASLNMIGDTDTTEYSEVTFFMALNLNRNVYDHTGHNSDEDKENTKEALLNQNFRLALNCAISRDTYTGFVNKAADRNMINSPKLEYTGEGVYYGHLVNDYLNNQYQVYPNEIDLSDGNDAFYSHEMCQYFISAAESDGISFPVSLDLPYYSGSETENARAQALKTSIESASENQILINLIGFEDSYDYYSVGYYQDDPEQKDYDLLTSIGWGPEEAVATEVLNDFCANYGLEQMGIVAENQQDLLSSIGFDTFQSLLQDANDAEDSDTRMDKSAEAEAYYLSMCYMIPLDTRIVSQPSNLSVTVKQDSVTRNLLITSNKPQWLNEMSQKESDHIYVSNAGIGFGTDSSDDYVRFVRDDNDAVTEIIILYKALLANNVASSEEAVEIFFPETANYDGYTAEINGLNACKETPTGLKVKETSEGIRFYFDDPGQEELDYLAAMIHPYVWDYSIYSQGKYTQGSVIEIYHKQDGSASDYYGSNGRSIDTNGNESDHNNKICLSDDGKYVYLPYDKILESGIVKSEEITYKAVISVYGYEDYYNSEETVPRFQVLQYANEPLPEGFAINAYLDDDCNLYIRVVGNDEEGHEGQYNYWVEAVYSPAINNGQEELSSGGKLTFINVETYSSCWLQNIINPEWEDIYYEIRTIDDSPEEYLYVSRKVLKRFLASNYLPATEGSTYYFEFETYGYENYTSDPEVEGQYIILPENLIKEAPQLIITETDEGDIVIGSEDLTNEDYIEYIEDLFYGDNPSESFISFLCPGREYGNAFWSLYQYDGSGSIYLDELHQLVLSHEAIVQNDITNGTVTVEIHVFGFDPDMIQQEITLRHAKKQIPDIGIGIDNEGNLIITSSEPEWFEYIEGITFERLLENDDEFYFRSKEVLHVSGNEAIIYKNDLAGLPDGSYIINFESSTYGTFYRSLELNGYLLERTAEVKVTCSKGDLIITCNDKNYMTALAQESKWYRGENTWHEEGGSIEIDVEDLSVGFSNSRSYYNGEETDQYTSYTLASTKTKITMKKQLLMDMYYFNTDSATVILRAKGYADVVIENVSLNSLRNPTIPDDVAVMLQDNGDLVITSSDNDWLKALCVPFTEKSSGGSVGFIPIDNEWVSYGFNNYILDVTYNSLVYSTGKVTIASDNLISYGFEGSYFVVFVPYNYRRYRSTDPITFSGLVQDAPAEGEVDFSLDDNGNLVISSEGNEAYLHALADNWTLIDEKGVITQATLSYIQIFDQDGYWIGTLYNRNNQYQNDFSEEIIYDEESGNVIVPRECLSEFSGNERRIKLSSFGYREYEGIMDFPLITVPSSEIWVGGESVQFFVNTDQDVIWSVDDETRATVDADGRMTAKKSGIVYLCAQVEGNEFVDRIPVLVRSHLVEEIRLTSPSQIIGLGKSITLTAEVLPVDATNKAVTWESSDITVATVSKGKVTAKKGLDVEGKEVTITATSKEDPNIKCSITLTVGPAVTKVSIFDGLNDITGQKLSIDPDVQDHLLLSTLTEPADGSDDVIWTSSNTKLATVDEYGNVSFVGAKGTVKITAKAGDGSGKSAVVTFNIAKLVKRVVVSGPNEVAIGKSIKLNANVFPADAANTALVWFSDNADIAVSGGKVTAKKTALAGETALIQAYAKDTLEIWGEYEITVTDPVTQVNIFDEASVNVTGKKLAVDPSVTSDLWFSASTDPAGASKAVTWTSSSTKLATVDENGHVEIVGAKGTVKITAKAADGSGKSSVVTLNIARLVTSITISGPTEVAVGKNIKLEAAVLPDEAANKKLDWSSSDTTTATVSGGKVTGKKAGTVVITATAKDGSGVTASQVVLVRPLMTSLIIRDKDLNELPANATIGTPQLEGRQYQLYYSFLPDGAGWEVEWKSSNTKIATVDVNGLVTFTGVKGSVKITVTAKDGSKKSASVTFVHKDAIRIGAAIYNFDDYFMQTYMEYISNRLDELSDEDSAVYEVDFIDAEGDSSLQAQQIETLLNGDYDGLIVQLVDPSDTMVADEIEASGIPAVFINRVPQDHVYGDKTCYVGVDAAAAGTMQGKMVYDLSAHGDIDGDGTVRYFMIIGDPGNTDSNYRAEYSVGYLTDRDVSVECLYQGTGYWSQGTAKSLVAEALNESDNVDVIFCCNDSMALGASQAVREAGMTVGEDIYIVGIDGLSEAFRAINRGHLTGTVINDAHGQAVAACNSVISMINGTVIEEKVIYIPYIYITAENISEYYTDVHYDVVFLADLGAIFDGGFNENTFYGIRDYCEANGLNYTYLQPAGSGDPSRDAVFEKAADEYSADVIVVAGFLWDSTLLQMIPQYPDVKVIYLDADDLYNIDVNYDGVDDSLEHTDNLAMITFAEQDAGYMAGYAAVIDGYRSLGFMGGMAVPAVVRFGYGFIEGAEDAALELGLAEGSIDMKYYYTGMFMADPQIKTLASQWYKNGTEIIFSCGGSIVNSVLEAAKEGENRKLIGVDTDEYITRASNGAQNEPLFVTSAMKDLHNTTYNALAAAYAGGDDWAFYTEDGLKTLGAVEGAVTLAPYRSENWNSLTKQQYDSILGKAAESHSAIPVQTDGINGAPIEGKYSYLNIDYMDRYPFRSVSIAQIITEPLNGFTNEDMIHDSIVQFCNETGSTCTTFDISTNPSDQLDEICSSGDYDVIVMGYWNKQNIVQQAAADYPNVRFLVFDCTIDFDSNPDIRNNVSSYTIKGNNKLAFAVGALSTLMSESGKGLANADKTIGFVGPAETIATQDYLIGYIQGAHYVDPQARILYGWVGDWTNAETANGLAMEQYGNGADVIFAVCNPAANGVFEAANSANKYAFGVDADQAAQLLDSHPAWAQHIVSSAVAQYAYPTKDLLDALYFNTIEWGVNNVYDFESGYLEIIETDVFNATVKNGMPQVYSAYLEIVQKLKNGEIEVGTAIGATQEYIDQEIAKADPSNP